MDAALDNSAGLPANTGPGCDLTKITESDEREFFPMFRLPLNYNRCYKSLKNSYNDYPFTCSAIPDSSIGFTGEMRRVCWCSEPSPPPPPNIPGQSGHCCALVASSQRIPAKRRRRLPVTCTALSCGGAPIYKGSQLGALDLAAELHAMDLTDLICPTSVPTLTSHALSAAETKSFQSGLGFAGFNFPDSNDGVFSFTRQ